MYFTTIQENIPINHCGFRQGIKSVYTLENGGSSTTPVHIATATVLLIGRSIKTTFLILPDTPNAKTLSWRNFLYGTDLIVDYKHGQWHFHGDRHRCYRFVPKD
ncbi:hypothetical protein QE152_g5730 [Popillia japonica]|uniref:Uncharacterized protein n=1 Tax=Popillia japonica TaxID=7064 RepID=A0AAW1MHR0_POPJA